MPKYLLLLCTIVLLAASTASAAPDTTATPPPQPASGPGGTDYASAKITAHRYGEGNSEFWIFEPADPAPKSAPLIIFNHGWSAMNPNDYGAWITHIVRRGNIVIYPRYQAAETTPLADFVPNTIAAVKAALAELQTGSHVRPELNHVAIVGHSMGGIITASLAALAAHENLPIPKAICCVEPGGPPLGGDLSNIDPATFALVIVGDQDRIAGIAPGKIIFTALQQIPPAKKDFVTLVSDNHGTPPLVADHMAPVAIAVLSASDQPAQPVGPIRAAVREHVEQNSLTALDYYGVWKLFDALTDDAFYGKNAPYALGNTPQQRFMGTWSDGVAVKELKIGVEAAK